MGVATSFTADRMLDIEQNAIVSGLVDLNGNLLLKKKNGTTVNAGSTVGPIGPDGPPGETGIPAGSIMVWSSNTIPTNWVECNGQAISRMTYSDLFAIIGVTYGIGNGTTTFNVPDLRGRAVVGHTTTDTDFNSLGKIGGSKTHQLTVNELAKHNHQYFRTKALGVENVGPSTSSVYGTTATVTNMQTEPYTYDSGNNQPHNNMQPYSTHKYIIKGSGGIGVVNNTVSNTLTNRMAALETRQEIFYDESYAPDWTGTLPTSEAAAAIVVSRTVPPAPYDRIASGVFYAWVGSNANTTAKTYNAGIQTVEHDQSPPRDSKEHSAAWYPGAAGSSNQVLPFTRLVPANAHWKFWMIQWGSYSGTTAVTDGNGLSFQLSVR